MHLTDRQKDATIWGVIIILGVTLGWTIGSSLASPAAEYPTLPPTPTPTTTPTPHIVVVEYENAICYRKEPSGVIVDCDRK